MKAVMSTPQPRRKSVQIVHRVASVAHADVIAVTVKAVLIVTAVLRLVKTAKAVVIAVKVNRLRQRAHRKHRHLHSRQRRPTLHPLRRWRLRLWRQPLRPR